jgi:acyltransferase
MKTNARQPWIDAFKGWGMLLIVVGHVWSLENISTFYMWLFAFHVPIFFYAAGLTLNTQGDSTWQMLQRRAPILLKPYLVFGLLGYAFYLAGFLAAQVAGLQLKQFDYGLLRPLLGIAYGSVGDGLLVNSPIWFLPALLIASALVHQLNRWTSSVAVRYGVCLALFVVGAQLALHIKLPWSFSSALCAVVFMQLGVDHKRIGGQKTWPRQRLWPLLTICFLVSMWAPINGDVGLAGPTVNNPILFLWFTLVGIGLSVALSQLIEHRLPILTWLGQNSLGVLVLHMLAIKGVKVSLSLTSGVGIHTLENTLAWGLVVLLVAMALTALAVKAIQRWWPWALGPPPAKSISH